MNRSIQAEGTLAQIKHNMNFKRFLSRGNRNILSEYILVTLTPNIYKLHNKIMNNKCSVYIYPLKNIS